MGDPGTISAPHGVTFGFGSVAARAGDVNGDRYADVIVSGGKANVVYVYFGAAAGLATTPDVVVHDPGNDADDKFGQALSGAGDLNGDGYSDLVVGAPGASSNIGSVYVYAGTAAGLASGPFVLAGPASIGDFGESVFGAAN